MKTFPYQQNPGSSYPVCPICKTDDSKEAVLIPIHGTGNDFTYEALQVHLDCLVKHAVYDPGTNLIIAGL